jgi:hypothetical protein
MSWGKIHDMVLWPDVFDPGTGILDRFIILVILSRIGLFVPMSVRIVSFYIRESRRIPYSRFHNTLKMINKRKRYVLSVVCGAKGSKAPLYGKRQVGSVAIFCVTANMKGRTSGYTKVAVKVGPVGQTDVRLGRAATRVSAPTDQTQSSTALESFQGMTVTELRSLLSQHGLSNAGGKRDLVERLETAAAGDMEETQEERHPGAFQDTSPTRLDTESLSMTSAEENTPVDSTMMSRLTDDGKENVCLDTAATTITAELKMTVVKQAPCVVQRGRKILRWLVTPST